MPHYSKRLFLWRFPTHSMCAFLVSPIRATFSAHIILLDLIITSHNIRYFQRILRHSQGPDRNTGNSATKLYGSLPRSFVQLLGPQSWVLNYTINAGVTTSNAASWCGTRLVALHSWMSWGWVPGVLWNVSQQTYSSIKCTVPQASSSSLHT